MRSMRTTTGAGAAILVFALLLPAPAVSQQPEAARTPDSTAESADSEVVITTLRLRRTGSSSLSRCDPANVNVENSLKSTVFPYYLMGCVNSYAPVDGDWGPDGPDPSSPTSYVYPDTRFDLAAAVQQLELGSLKAATLPVRTEPVVTRQIMEQRILQGKIRRGEIELDSRSSYDPDRYDGSDSSRPAARRTVRSQPAAARSAPPARSASPPSSSGQSQPKGRRGSRTASSPES